MNEAAPASAYFGTGNPVNTRIARDGSSSGRREPQWDWGRLCVAYYCTKVAVASSRCAISKSGER